MNALARRVLPSCIALVAFVAWIQAPWSSWGKEKPGGMPSDLPASEVTLGGRFYESQMEGFGDVLAPVMLFESGLLYVNPRATFTDHSAEEYNLGVGYRHLLGPRNLIVGANAYYDYRSTELGAEFNQLGLGVEFLSEWVDARANVYLPEDQKETVGKWDTETVTKSVNSSTRWSTPYAVGNTIKQKGTKTTVTTITTTRQHFEQYEEAMEGWDAEFGVKLPLPLLRDRMDLRVFGGYYDFDAPFGDDIRGFKGRLELRALPSVFVDAEVYEDKELNGNDYMVGARVSVPCELQKISQGQNPFEGAGEGFKADARKPDFVNRLTEMVIRDPRVRTEVSEVQEIVSLRQVSTETQAKKKGVKSTLASDVTFVDSDNATGIENGSWENPYRTVTGGVANVAGTMVFVLDAAVPYGENVVLGAGLTLWGSGCPFPGKGGKGFGTGIYPILDGVNPQPTIWIQGNGVTVAGLNITHSGPGTGAVVDPHTGLDATRAGIYGSDITDIDIRCNRIEKNSYGILLTAGQAVQDFSAVLRNNTVVSNSSAGLVILGTNGWTGTFTVDVGCDFSDNDGPGVLIQAMQYGSANVWLHDLAANGNSNAGVVAITIAGGDASVTFENVVADGNGSNAVGVQATAASTGGLATVALNDVQANANGIGVMTMVQGFSGDTVLRNITANNNSIGMQAQSIVFGPGQYSRVTLENVEAISNRSTGVAVNSQVIPGGAGASVTARGVCVDDNGTNALGMGVTVGGGGGTSVLRLEGIRASRNAVGVSASTLGPGDADIYLHDIVANNNAVLYGVVAQSLSSTSRVSIVLDDIEANGNAQGVAVAAGAGAALSIDMGLRDVNANDSFVGPGITLQVVNPAGGTLSVLLDDVDANRNRGGGISAPILMSMKDVALGFHHVNANDNTGGVGILVMAMSVTGRASVVFEDVSANSNLNYGIQATANGMAGATMRFDDIQANDNQGTFGTGIGASLGSALGRADAWFEDITADLNVGCGINAQVSGSAGASARFEDVSTSDGGSGPSAQGIAASIISTLGQADAWLENVRADRNTAGSIWLQVQGMTGASLTLHDVSASDNTNGAAFGIQANVIASGPDATASAIFDDVAANNNGGFGINVTAGGPSNIVGRFIDISASGNGGGGFNAMLNGGGHDIIGTFSDIQANNNGGAFGFFADLIGGGHDIRGTFNNIQANGNGADGFMADLIGAGSNLTAVFRGIAANSNTNVGFLVTVAGAGGDLRATFDGVSASRNEGSYGALVTIAGGGNSFDADFDEVTANDNTNAAAGLFVYAGGGVGGTYVRLEDIQASRNATNGVEITAESPTNASLVRINDLAANYNGGVGLVVSNNAAGGTASILGDDTMTVGNFGGLNLTAIAVGGDANIIFTDAARYGNTGYSDQSVAVSIGGTAYISILP